VQWQVNELQAKGLIHESLSPYVVPTLLVPEKDGSTRMCVDSRVMNKTIIKCYYPILQLEDLLNELHGSTIISKIHHRSGYYEIRICEGDKWKTNFKTKGGLF